MSMIEWTAAAVFGVAVTLTGLGGALFRPGSWYEGLSKPPWRPPNALFGPVWLVLYIMIAVAGWRIWAAAGDAAAGQLALGVYAIQLALNFLWSAIMFGLRRIGAALAEMAALWLSIVACIWLFAPIDPIAAWLFTPYLVWVSFAFVLNWSIWRRNLGPA